MLLKCVSDHAESLADGRVVAPGETIKLNKDQAADPYNQERLEAGAFIEADEPAKSKSGSAKNEEANG